MSEVAIALVGEGLMALGWGLMLLVAVVMSMALQAALWPPRNTRQRHRKPEARPTPRGGRCRRCGSSGVVGTAEGAWARCPECHGHLD